MMIQKRPLPLHALTKIHEQKLLTFYIGKLDQAKRKHINVHFRAWLLNGDGRKLTFAVASISNF